MKMEPLIRLLQIEIEFLRTIEKLANDLNTSIDNFNYLFEFVDNWNPVMDLIGLPQNGEVIMGFTSAFSRESFEDVFFDLHYQTRGDSYELCKGHLEFMKNWIEVNVTSTQMQLT